MHTEGFGDWHDSGMARGRFAPSPTGQLHLGNLRTALVAWLFARSAGSEFLVRVEDLDLANATVEKERQQLADLAAIGLDWDGAVIRQSERFDLYHQAIADLTARGLTYECTCTRSEIREAASAAHGDFPEGIYPGTCRTLTAAQRGARGGDARPAAIRLRAQVDQLDLTDRLKGDFSGVVDDVVLRRNDGVPAYNLAVVIDDAAQVVEEVVRGDDLLSSSPRQAHLADLLGVDRVGYAHFPLVLGPDGRRLAKRHGGVSLSDRLATGSTVTEVRMLLAASLGLAEAGEPVSMSDLIARFEPSQLPTDPWVLDPERLATGNATGDGPG